MQANTAGMTIFFMIDSQFSLLVGLPRSLISDTDHFRSVNDDIVHRWARGCYMIRGFKIDFGQTSLETRGCYAVLFSRAAPVAQSLPCPDAESELTKQIMKKIFSVSVLIGILAAVSVSSFAQGRSCQRGYD